MGQWSQQMIDMTQNTEWAYQIGEHLALCFYQCADTPVLLLHLASGETAQWDAVKYEHGLEVMTGLKYERVDGFGWFDMKPSEHKEMMGFEDEVEDWIEQKYDERQEDF